MSSKNNYCDKSQSKKVHYTPVQDGPHSPYNFVPISSKGVLEDPRSEKYSMISDEAYNGEICYRVTAMTPIFVDNGKEGEENGFFKSKGETYAIPGSTIRGLIRNNVQILSRSSIKDDIEDYKLMYRAITDPSLKSDYYKIIGNKLENVRAGFLENRSGTYYLHYRSDIDTCDNGFNGYYTVNEKYDVLDKKNENDDFKDIINKLQNIDYHEARDRNNKLYWKGDKNPNYVPYKERVGYQLKNGKVTAIKKVDSNEETLKNDGYDLGYILSSGRVERKKVFFVIPDIPQGKDIENGNGVKLSDNVINEFNVDYKSRENTLGTDKKGRYEKQKQKVREFYQLPKEGEKCPVFFVKKKGKNDKYYFGYTPHLRVMFDYSINTNLGLDEKKSTEDFAKTMFGYSVKNDSLKSKVFFTDAILTEERGPISSRNLILSGPKPTSYLEYLIQKEGELAYTYNSKNMQIRGIKQYWLHEEVDNVNTTGSGNDNENIKSGMKPLDKDSCFKGVVRFQNLSEMELGLLIWSIRLEENSMMNVGKGKPYGYGRIKFDNVELYLARPEENYMCSDKMFSKNPLEKIKEEDVNGYIEHYKTFADVKNDQSIQDFLMMKSLVLKGRDVSYMTAAVKNSEFDTFKKNINPLPTISDVVKNKENKHNR